VKPHRALTAANGTLWECSTNYLTKVITLNCDSVSAINGGSGGHIKWLPHWPPIWHTMWCQVNSTTVAAKDFRSSLFHSDFCFTLTHDKISSSGKTSAAEIHCLSWKPVEDGSLQKCTRMFRKFSSYSRLQHSNTFDFWKPHSPQTVHSTLRQCSMSPSPSSATMGGAPIGAGGGHDPPLLEPKRTWGIIWE